MLTSTRHAAFPARPPGIAEWEDLLVRLELGPRIAATVLEEIPREHWERVGGGWSPCAHLAHLAAREHTLAGWLEALRRGEILAAGPEARVPGNALAQLERFTRLRARNFGSLQRRGVDVWEWEAPHPEGGVVSVFQVLSEIVRHDGRHIAGMRVAC